MASGRVPGWVVGLVAAAHGLAFGWALGKGSWNFPDSARYWQAAENLYRYGELYARPWVVATVPQGQAVQEFTIRPVGYPLALLGLGGMAAPPVLLLVVQNLLSLLNICLVLRWWASRARPSSREWGLAVISILTFPAQLIYANAVMSELLLQTTVLALVAAAWFFIRTRQARYFAGMAGIISWALLLKPVFCPAALVFLGSGALLAWRCRRVELAVIGLMPLLVMGLYMGWNEYRTGYFHFSSITEINLLHYNAAGVVRQLEGPAAEEEWVAGVLRQANAQPDFAARQRFIEARGRAELWRHPFVYGRQHTQGMVALFLDPGRFDVSQFLGLKAPAGGGLLVQVRTGHLGRALGGLPPWLLGLLALVGLANAGRLALACRGFWRLRRAGPALRCGRWVAAGLLLYVALLTGPLGAARFLVPGWPLLLGLALVGLKGIPLQESDAEQLPPARENQGQG